MNEADRNAPHAQRMRHKKAVVDVGVARATEDRGLIVVNTGAGKGKSTAGFGMIARVLGHGMHVGIVQFIKGSYSTGEEAFFRRFPEIAYHVMGEGFTWETQDRPGDMRAARAGWDRALELLRSPSIDLVLLDELNIVLAYHYLTTQEVISALAERPTGQHVVITGRGAPRRLIELADTVTDMREVKHAFKLGIRAQQGVEL